MDVETFAFTCPQGTYNSQATQFFNTESGVIRALMNQRIEQTPLQQGIFTLTWYTFFIVTAGAQIPGGLFVPAMIIGCSLGELMNDARKWAYDSNNPLLG
jgi:hypothetical protein